MKAVLSYAFAVYFFLSGTVLFGLALLVTLFTAPFDPQRRMVHRFCCFCARHYMDMMPGWNCTYQGLENLPLHGPSVLVCNHQSIADIILLYATMSPFKFVAKESLFRAPLIGWVIWLNQYLTCNRSVASIKLMLRKASGWLSVGMPILMFPEGTRSPDGRIHQFMPGAFKLAIDCNVPVIPIVLDGTYDVLPRGARRLNFRQNMQVRILAPLRGNDFGNDVGKMRDYTRALMRKNLREMRVSRAVLRQPAVLKPSIRRQLPPGAAV